MNSHKKCFIDSKILSSCLHNIYLLPSECQLNILHFLVYKVNHIFKSCDIHVIFINYLFFEIFMKSIIPMEQKMYYVKDQADFFHMKSKLQLMKLIRPRYDCKFFYESKYFLPDWYRNQKGKKLLCRMFRYTPVFYDEKFYDYLFYPCITEENDNKIIRHILCIFGKETKTFLDILLNPQSNMEFIPDKLMNLFLNHIILCISLHNEPHQPPLSIDSDGFPDEKEMNYLDRLFINTEEFNKAFALFFHSTVFSDNNVLIIWDLITKRTVRYFHCSSVFYFFYIKMCLHLFSQVIIHFHERLYKNRKKSSVWQLHHSIIELDALMDKLLKRPGPHCEQFCFDWTRFYEHVYCMRVGNVHLGRLGRDYRFSLRNVMVQTIKLFTKDIEANTKLMFLGSINDYKFQDLF